MKLLNGATLAFLLVFAGGSSPRMVQAEKPVGQRAGPAAFAGFPRKHHKKKKSAKKAKKPKNAKVESLPKQ